MKCYEATINTTGTDDQIINASREVVARCGYQVGNCDIIEKTRNSTKILIDIHDHQRLNPLEDDIIMFWGGLKVEIIGIASLQTKGTKQ